MKHVDQKFKSLILIGLTASLAAFTGPQKDDLIELKGFLYARSGAHFRASDENKITVLKPGTRALIKETKYFESSKNYGMCLELKNASISGTGDKCVWVYYNINHPSMALFSVAENKEKRDQTLEAWMKESSTPKQAQQKAADSKPEKKSEVEPVTEPEKAKAAETIQAVPAIIEKAEPKIETKVAAGTKETKKEKSSKAGAEAEAQIAVKTIDQLNEKASQIMSKSEVPTSPSCPDGKCNRRIEAFQTCTDRNDYLEAPLASLLSGSSPLSNYLNSEPKEVIRSDCIKTNLTKNGSGRYQTCSANESPRAIHSKACISKNYTNITAKSFNLAADCFGSLNGNSEVSKRQLALSVFSLMAQESGMHLNVSSPTGAGGPGQLTAPAIAEVNKNLKGLKNQLSQASNPMCKQVLVSALEQQMDSKKTCDRIGIAKENPLKNIAYSFAYQNLIAKSLTAAYLDSKTYKNLTSSLSEEESARLKFSLAGWGHNTGPGGLQSALRGLLRDYVRGNKSLHSKQDVDQLLSDLKHYMHKSENRFYHENIRAKLSAITKEPSSCLAN